MFKLIKDMFSEKSSTQVVEIDKSSVLDMEEIKNHFKTVTKDAGFVENTHLIESIKKKLHPNRKNIFILDDICEIVEILKDDFEKYLSNIGRVDEFNVVSLCGKSVGFDMLSILANHSEVTVDAIMTDIIFGGNEKINGKKIIIDGVDIVIILKSVNDNLNYIMFTGNVFSENIENSYSFSKKFEQHIGESILDHVLIKDAQIVFDDSVFERIIKEL